MLSILAQSPTVSPDYSNRSNMQQKFLSFHQSPGTPAGNMNMNSSIQQQHQQQFYPMQSQNPNASISGPPTQGLFDGLKNDKPSFHAQNKSHLINNNNNSGIYNQSVHEQSYHNQSGFNQSRIMSPIPNLMSNEYNNNSYQQQQQIPLFAQPAINQSISLFNNNVNFWITIFGFPQTSTSTILSHFSQCGTILEKVFSSENGNWIHIRFSSRLECDKALMYNGKIICNNLMIGVTRCTDDAVLEKENLAMENREFSKIRSLTHVAYKNAQSPTEIVPGSNANAPKRTTGIVNKAMDLFFGW